MTLRFADADHVWVNRRRLGNDPAAWGWDPIDEDTLRAWTPKGEECGPWRYSRAGAPNWVRPNLHDDLSTAVVDTLGWTVYSHEFAKSTGLVRIAHGSETGEAGKRAADLALLAHWTRNGRS